MTSTLPQFDPSVYILAEVLPPFSDFSSGLLVQTLHQFSPHSFFLLGKGPDGFVLKLQQLNPPLILFKDKFSLGEFPGQVIRIDLNTRLDGFSDEVFGFLLKVPGP